MQNYLKAPFNFVRLPEKLVIRYKSIDKLPVHNSFKGKDNEELLSGYIEYSLTAKTPIIVSNGVEGKDSKHAKFFENLEGKKAIPGNTIRGMVRSNLQILSLSNVLGSAGKDGKLLNSDIQDSRFLFRDVAGNNSLSEKYKNIMGIEPQKRIAKNVYAGYITREGNNYSYVPAKKINNMPYIRIDEIDLRKIADSDVEIKYMYTEKLLDYEGNIDELKKVVAKEMKAKRKYFENNEQKESEKVLNESYAPKPTEISFEIDNKSNIIKKVGARGKYTYNGVILSGGYILGKRSHYIIGEEDDSIEAKKISEHEIEDYKKDLVLTRKAKKKAKSGFEKETPRDIEGGNVLNTVKDEEIEMEKEHRFYALPERGKKKPFFYINYAGRFHFGFTPYMRMFYRKSVLDGIPEVYKTMEGISYAEALFGFSGRACGGKEVDYKSRLSFEDAVAEGNPELYSERGIGIILATPKPTCYKLYLKQDESKSKKELYTYESDDFRIRGIKQYWLKDRIIKGEDKKNKNVAVSLHPLKEQTKFKGRIYFNNLYADELGLLLWSLKLEDNCFQTIGMAKPYGFGRVKVENIKLQVENLKKKYSEFCFNYEEPQDIDKYISIYKEEFSKKYLLGKPIEEYDSIKELMAIKSQIFHTNDCNYMELQEYRRKNYFPTIIEHIQKKTKKNNNNNYVRQEEVNNRKDRNTGSKSTRNKSTWSKNTRDKSKTETKNKKSKSLFTIENDRKDIVEKLEEFKKKL